MIKIKQLVDYAKRHKLTVTNKVHSQYVKVYIFKVVDQSNNTMILEWGFGSRPQQPYTPIECRLYPAVNGKPTKTRPLKFVKYSKDNHSICRLWLTLFISNRQTLNQLSAFNL